MSKTPGRRTGWDGTAKSNLPPQRLQLFRGRKFDLKEISRRLNGLPAVRIDQNSGWENPFLDTFYAPTKAVEVFRQWLTGNLSVEELVSNSGRGRFSDGKLLINKRKLLLSAMPALRGKNVACWCKLRDPCHGDVLLAIVNTPINQV